MILNSSSCIMTLQEWLQTPIQFETDYYIHDILDTITTKTWNWIQSQEDLIVTIDYDSFKRKYINFIYTKYHLP